MDFEDFKEKYRKVEPVENVHSVSSVPLVSVCVQTYQHAGFIKGCLDGILMQKTDFPFEVLIGEDGSTDGTREICIEYAEEYPDKIRLFLHHRESNIHIGGRPTGRFNFLYNLFSANGKYIALLDGDDYWTDPLKLQRQVDFLEANPDFVAHHTSFFNLYADGKMVPNQIMLREVTTFNHLLEGNTIVSSSVLLRRELLAVSDWFTKVFVGDWVLYLTATRNGGKIYFDKTRAVVYRKNVGIFQHYKDPLVNLKKILELKRFVLGDPLFSAHQSAIKSSIKETQLNLMAAYVKRGYFFNSFPMFRKVFFKEPIKTLKILSYSLKLRFRNKLQAHVDNP